MFKFFGVTLTTASILVASGCAMLAAEETTRVNKKNVHLFLKEMQKQTKPGQKVNEYARLLSTKASGKKFTVLIEMFLPDGVFVPEHFQGEDIKKDILAEERQLCNTKSLVAAIKHGATIERIYVNVEGTELYRAKANSAYCKKIKA